MINFRDWGYLQTALQADAYSAKKHHTFESLNSWLNQKRALVAVARKLLVTIWHVLTKRVVDRYADEEQVAVTVWPVRIWFMQRLKAKLFTALRFSAGLHK